MEVNAVVQLRKITKTFSGVKALSDVDLDLMSGEIHCFAGENGSGKSTLVKVVSGVHSPDGGSIVIDGHHFDRLSPTDAMKAGVQVIYQDLALFEHMTVAENIAISKLRQDGRSIVDWKEVRAIATAQMERVGVTLDLDATIFETSMGNRQIVAICRALALDAKVLFMDEPTTALTKHEVDRLLSIVLDMKASGMAIVFISHKMDEVFQVSDRITVFRDGYRVGSFLNSELNRDQLAFHMTGREVQYSRYKPCGEHNQRLLGVKGLSKKGMYSDLDFEILRGDIVGFIGLLGSGRTELALSLYGLNPPESGSIEFESKRVDITSPNIAKSLGIALLPEDRLKQGLFLERDVRENISSSVVSEMSNAFGVLDGNKEERLAHEGVQNLRVKTASIFSKIKNLSGGNQQKAVIAKWVQRKPKLFIMDSPTVGIDIGSKSEIYDIIQTLANSGMSIMLISDEVEEILNNCNRVIVMHSGRIVAELDQTELASANVEQRIYALMGQDSVPSDKAAAEIH